jgi:light-regulated signal transduction histidine kinase (bacteriophytochrome)
LKSPLANISGLTDLLTDSYNGRIDDESKEIINKSSSEILMIDSLLEFSKSNVIEKKNNTEISVVLLHEEISALLHFKIIVISHSKLM